MSRAQIRHALLVVLLVGCGSRENVRDKVADDGFRKEVTAFCSELEGLVRMIEAEAKMPERHPQATKVDDHYIRIAEPSRGLEDLKPRIEKIRREVFEESSTLSFIQERAERGDKDVAEKYRKEQMEKLPALKAEITEIRAKVAKK